MNDEHPYGEAWSRLVNHAAMAEEYYTPDELEEFAEKERSASVSMTYNGWPNWETWLIYTAGGGGTMEVAYNHISRLVDEYSEELFELEDGPVDLYAAMILRTNLVKKIKHYHLTGWRFKEIREEIEEEFGHSLDSVDWEHLTSSFTERLGLKGDIGPAREET